MKLKILITALCILLLVFATFFASAPRSVATADKTSADIAEEVHHLDYPATPVKWPTVNRKTDIAYAAKHLIAFDAASEDFSPLTPIDDRLDGYTLYLSGETSHSVGNNAMVVLYLTKYLYHTQGVNYLVLEMGYAESQLLNRYIQTGDEELLDKIFAYELQRPEYAFPQNTSRVFNEDYQLMKDLCEFNKGLPDGEKLTLLGFDIGMGLNLAGYYLKTLIPDEPAPDDIKASIDSIRNTTIDNVAAIPLTQLYNEIQLKETSYREFLGDNFFNFKFTIENVMQKMTTSNMDPKFFVYREDAIIRNWITLIEHYDIQKAHGHAGNFHTDINNMLSYGPAEGNEYTMASYLWRDYPRTKNKVYSIQFIYDNCKDRDTSGGKISKNFIAKRTDVPIDTSYAFIDYTGDDSPLKSVQNGELTYQYGSMGYVIMYDSPANTLYKPKGK